MTGINASFDEKYDIRLANIDDIPAIMNFIDVHWKKGHIMAVNRNLFEYEYVHGNEVDFVLAIDRDTKVIEGIFGFLRCTKERTGDIWGSMWKVSDNPENMKLLGIELAKRVYVLTGCKSHIGNGANPKTTIPLRKIFFREKTTRMKQFYRLNENFSNFTIAEINNHWNAVKLDGLPDYTIKEFKSFEDMKVDFDVQKCRGIPRKDEWYVEHRFFKHPVYRYNCFGIFDTNDKCIAIFFGRNVRVGESSVYRIVDYYGEHSALKGIFDEIGRLMKEENCEYVDFFEFGIDDEYLKAAGFRNRDDDNNIIPNYFEPFVKANIDIWAHYIEEGTTFFKADGDQDRPNFAS